MKLLSLIKEILIEQKTILANGPYPGISDVLRKIVGRKKWKNLQLHTPDRRQLVEKAAGILGMSENELIKIIAEKLDIPVTFNPAVTDINYLPEEITFFELRNFGVLPIIGQQQVSGIVCVDPACLNLIPNLYNGANIYLSSWSTILSSLDESEQNYRVFREEQRQLEVRKGEEILKHLILKITDQALKQNTNRVVFLPDQSTLVYTFRGHSAEEWSGQIEQKTAQKLLSYFQSIIESNIRQINLSQIKGEDLKLELTYEHGRFALNIPEKIIRIDYETSSESRFRESAKIMPFPKSLKRGENSDKILFSKDNSFRILIVDDNSTFISVIEKYLLKHNLSAVSAANADQAITLLHKEGSQIPDIIISDLNMPDRSGYDFIRALKEESRLSLIPVIALTSDDRTETELESLNSGVDAFISKTKDPMILLMHIRRLLNKTRVAA